MAGSISFKDALDQGIISTYQPATEDEAKAVREALTRFASSDFEVASFTQNEDGSATAFLIGILWGDGFDVTIKRRG